jgi:hypothetical protein
VLVPFPTSELEDYTLSAGRQLIIQYIHSNPPYLEAVSARNLRTRHAVVTCLSSVSFSENFAIQAIVIKKQLFCDFSLKIQYFFRKSPSEQHVQAIGFL